MTRIKNRRDTAATWASVNPVLADGEIGVDKTNGKIKVGDGATAWNTLAYLTAKLATARKINGVPFDGSADIVTNLTPEQFGAVGNGTTDDSTALQNCFNAAAGKTVFLDPTKSYKHTVVLSIGGANTTVLGGGTLLATAEQTSSVWITANNVTLRNITIKMSSTTQRWNAYEMMKLRLANVSGTHLVNVLIDGSAAAGIFVGGSSNYLIERCYIKNTRADGIYTTESSHHGLIVGCTADTTGDDGFSIISNVSGNNAGPCHHIVNIGCQVNDGGARGFSAMGGNDIEILDFYVNTIQKAGLYLGSESDNYTNQTKVTARGGTIIAANSDGTGQGGILVISANTRTVDRVDIANITIRDLPSTALRLVGFQRFDTSTLTYCTIANINAWNSNQPYPLDSVGVTPLLTSKIFATGITMDNIPVTWVSGAGAPLADGTSLNVARQTLSVTSAVTLPAVADLIVLIGASGAPTLPTAVGNPFVYAFSNVSGGNRTVATTSSQTINGSTTATIANGATARYVSNGSNWVSI